jgi:hypothetical protein
MRLLRVSLALMVLLVARGAGAQPYILSSPVTHLATIFTELYGPGGLKVDSEATLADGSTHTAHFNSDFQSEFGQFGTALVGQFVSLPLPSPTSGFTYQFDPSLGVFQRTKRSFGPILADRADTLGGRRVSIGFAYQRFTFDTIEGLDLNNVPAVFTHDSAQLLGGRQDVITTSNLIEATVNQNTTYITMGVTEHFDVSLAIPLVTNSLRVVSTATIHRIGTTDPLTHFFRQSDGSVGDTRIFNAEGSASGVGDLMVRLKRKLGSQTNGGLAVGLDLRIPTGDALNLLGSGTTGVQPFAIWSGTIQQISPHVNVSYRWNGNSVLAGDPATGRSGNFPDTVAYALGADVSANQRVTLAFDVLGRYTINAERLKPVDFHALDNQSVFPNISFVSDSYNDLSGSAGLKAMLADKLLVTGNVLFKLDDHGLRDRVTSLLGLQYSF